eukprot:gene1023-574_t
MSSSAHMNSILNASVCDPNGNMESIVEIQSSTSAVTNFIFGQERFDRHFILMAVTHHDGTAAIYKIARTKLEKEILKRDMHQDLFACDVNMSDKIDVPVLHKNLKGHTKPITNILFSPMEDMLITTSIDKRVIIWNADTGEAVKVFTESAPVLSCLYMPFDPKELIIANSNGVLRMVNTETGSTSQKLTMQTGWIASFVPDHTGNHIFCGSQKGSVHVLKALTQAQHQFGEYVSTISQRFQVKVCDGMVTDMTFVAARGGNPARLLLTSTDSNITILDVQYDVPSIASCSVVQKLVCHRRLEVPISRPIKNIFLRGERYHCRMVCGSDKNAVYVLDLSDFQITTIKRHESAILSVSCNATRTVLASGDQNGRIVLQRAVQMNRNDTPAQV